MNNSNPHLLLFLIFLSGFAFSQNNTLKGRVLFQNSGLPAVNFLINGEKEDGANIATTDETGFFKMEFSNRIQGNSVKIKIEKFGFPIEIVNEDVFKRIIIPSNADKLLEIIICKKGERDIAAMRYYRIIKTSYEEDLMLLNNKLKKLTVIASISSEEIKKLNFQIEKLNIQNDSTEIYKQAFRIASIDKNRANERIKEYINLLDKGTSIREALRVLNEESAQKQITSSLDKINEGIDELENLAEGSVMILDYKKAITCYTMIINDVEQIGNSERFGHIYTKLFFRLIDNNEIYKADTLSPKLITWIKKYGNFDDNYANVIDGYIALGMTNRYIGGKNNLLKSIGYYKKALEISKSIADTSSQSRIFNNIGLLFRDLELKDSSKIYLYKSIEILNNKPKLISPSHFVTSLINLGNIESKDFNNDSLALKYFKFALFDINYFKLDSVHLARAYNGISEVMDNLGQKDSTLYYANLAISIARKKNLLGDLSSYLMDLGIFYQNTDLELAIKYDKEALDIATQIYLPGQPWLGVAQFNLAFHYVLSGDGNSAFPYIISAMYNRELSFSEGQSEYNNVLAIFNLVNEGIRKKNNENIDSVKNNVQRLYSKLIQLNKKYYYWRAICFRSLKLYQEAVLDFNEAIPMLSDSFCIRYDLYNSLGLCYYFIGKYELAIKSYNKGLSINPKINMSNYYNNIGCAQVKNKLFNEALNSFKNYEKLEPTNGRTYRNWAMYYALQNDKDRAFFNLEKAVTLGFNDYQWFTTDKSLESLRDNQRYKNLVEKIKTK